MYELVLIALFLLLVLSARYFQYLARTLGPQKYMTHMTFEGWPIADTNSKIPSYKNISLLDIFYIGLFALYILKKDFFPEYLWQFIVGSLVMMYAFILGASLASVLVFKYALQYPEQLSGQTHFKSGIVQAIQRSVALQTIIPCIALAFMLPSPLIYGALAALGVLLLLTFRKLPIY